jgi:hypothetical protein
MKRKTSIAERWCLQKFLADPRANKSGHENSFQLAITQAQTNLHCHAYALATQKSVEALENWRQGAD